MSGLQCAASTCVAAAPPARTQESCPNPYERGCGVVEIAGGTFDLGELNARNAAPVRPGVTVRGFAIDAYEVTIARFRRFWNAGHPSPPSSIPYPGGTLSCAGTVNAPIGGSWSLSPGTLELHPIDSINWYTAQAFCVWDGGRLPTEGEWEFAARGRAAIGLAPGRFFPWGDAAPSPTCDRAHWNRCAGDDAFSTRRVGSLPPTAGLFDLSGSVGEWVADNYQPLGGACWAASAFRDPICQTSPAASRTLRNDSWAQASSITIRAASRSEVPANQASDDFGIRCVRPLPGRLAPPRQLSPLSTAIVTSRRPTLRWSLSPVAVGTRVQICRDRACASVEQTIDTVIDNARPSEDLAAGVHFWRLFGRDGVAVGPASGPTWEFFVGRRSAPTDTSIGSIADLNGDGRADLAVGAPGTSNFAGSVQVHLTTAAGLPSGPSVRLASPDGAAAEFGSAVVSVGDLNGDGFPELAVGASSVSGVHIYPGAASGFPSTPIRSLRCPDGSTGGFGVINSISGVGDVNGDGYGDLLVGAPDVASREGRSYLYLGGLGGVGSTPDITLTGPAGAGGRFGSHTSDLGDVDLDGFADFAVGASASGNPTGAGRAYVFHGSPLGLRSTSGTAMTSPVGGIGYGGVEGAGDLDGDGIVDLAIRDDYFDGRSGRVYVYRGAATGFQASPSVVLESPDGPGSYFGISLAGACDLNGDGYDDLVVGAPGAAGGTGRAHVYYGRPGGISATPSLSLQGPTAGDSFAFGAPRPGDMNGDGYADLAVGAAQMNGSNGRVYLYYGSNAGLPSVPTLTVAAENVDRLYFGSQVAETAIIVRVPRS